MRGAVLFVAIAGCVAGCDFDPPEIDGCGVHACPGDAGTGGTGVTIPSDAASDAHASCFLNVDCPASLAPSGSCLTVECDPTLHKTDPGSTVRGCYTLHAPEGTPCTGGDGGVGACSVKCSEATGFTACCQ